MAEQDNRPYPSSKKSVKPIAGLLYNKFFWFNRQLANWVDKDGKSVIRICINGKVTIIPVERDVSIDYDVFCVLRDAGMISSSTTYEKGKIFEPFYKPV